ncbi:YgiT-type zinc finger protein [Salinibacter ruber]
MGPAIVLEEVPADVCDVCREALVEASAGRR